MPGQTDDAGNSVRELGFNPLRNLVDHTANKKYVLVFSSDADAILNQIAAFAEEAETTDAVLSVLAAAVTGTAREDLSQSKLDKPARLEIATKLQELAARKGIASLNLLQSIVTAAKASVEALP